ncbi:MAG: haloacid dehalogenase type II [Marinospirillum sp.]|uniref:haloacid dehalogenase type II n=1 Tax=Marinospirillum sp. TaxID=2183934 RepID=UPI0019F52FDB|nr:haloacid dehalogenase type II [Marinospirillum sp.]MBE0508398.1 haloacid dehalogenase type II [Marinospirillum sp.]
MLKPTAIFFDVNETLLDLQPVKESIGEALGGRPELVPLWFTTLLQYSLVTTVADQYRDFGEIAVACLQMTARNQGIELDEATAKKAVAPIRALPAHPDVAPALERLSAAGYRLFALTNSSRAAADAQLHHAGLDGFFEAALSVEDVGVYKPHARVYQWAAQQAGVQVAESLLVAAHGWDVAGASWAGMRSAFVERPGQQLFPLGPISDLEVASFKELADRLVKTAP